MQIREALRRGRDAIARLGSDEAELEAEILLRHALGLDRAHLYQHLSDDIGADRHEAYEGLLTRRLAHEPVPYITGNKEFFGLEFEVTPAALIPRPETETLVEAAIAFARERDAKPLTIVDVGVGAGTIAVPLAVNLPEAHLIATDISAEALDLARRNAERHGVAGRISFVRGDLLLAVRGPVDIIAANPPYLATAIWENEIPEIKDYEPRFALDGGADGLDAVRRLLGQAPERVAPGGALFCEIGEWQGAAARELAAAAFPAGRVEVRPDLAGRDRVLAVYT